MVGSNDGESPLEVAAGAAGPETTKAFELLTDETRLAILLALWEAYDPLGDERVSFSALQEHVGISDSGQFNYHLGKLKGQFVEEMEGGYKLGPVGNKIVRAIIGGVGLRSPTLEPTEIDMDCPLCGAPTAITYQDGRLFQLCTECEGNMAETDEFPGGMLYSWRLDPAGLDNRDPEEIYSASSIGNLRRTIAMVDGVCPECSGAVSSQLKVCENHDLGPDDVCPNCGRRIGILALYQCTVCKFTTGGPPSSIVSQHPAVIAFYYQHGVNFQFGLDFQQITRVLELGEAHEQTLESTDPLRIRVTVRYEGDELNLLLDRELNVIEAMD